MKWIDRFATILSITAFVAASHGQTAPAQEPAEDEPEPKLLWNRFEIEIPGWSTSGNRNKLRQYATPARGYVIRRLEIVNPAGAGETYTRLSARGTPDQDMVGDARFVSPDGKFDVQVQHATHRFYDPTPLVIGASHDRRTEVQASYKILPEVGAFWRFAEQERDLVFDPPKDKVDTRTKSITAGVSGTVLGGAAEVTVADNRVYDRTGSSPTSTRQRLDARFSRELGPRFSIDGAYSDTAIEQLGTNTSSIRSWAFGADWIAGPSTSLQFDMRNDSLEMPNVENAFVRERFYTTARLTHRFKKTSFQFAYKHREFERVRADQLFVDVPKWDTYEARLTGRLSPDVRYSLRGSWEHLTGRATMVGVDPRALYWDDRVFGQARIDGGADRFHGYATYTFRFDQNTPRQVEIRKHHVTVGGFYALSDTTSAHLEVASETFRAGGAAEVQGLALDEFFPSSTSYSVGIDHALSPADSFSFSLNHFVTRYGNPLMVRDGNVRGTEISASYERTLGPDSSVSLFVSPWRYTDRLVEQMGYRATVAGIRFSTRF